MCDMPHSLGIVTGLMPMVPNSLNDRLNSSNISPSSLAFALAMPLLLLTKDNAAINRVSFFGWNLLD
jgi:hypothetical protein